VAEGNKESPSLLEFEPLRRYAAYTISVSFQENNTPTSMFHHSATSKIVADFIPLSYNLTRMRLRITFAKQGTLRYIGHLDLHKVWERTLRRAGLPLTYSQGYHPQPKIQLASALPLGFSSRAELVDIWLDKKLDLKDLPERLQEDAPPGLDILDVEEVDERGPALQTQINAAEYEITLLDPPTESRLSRRLSVLMEAESLPRERRGKAYDLRPLIYELRFIGTDMEGNPRLFMCLSAGEGNTGRPDEVLAELGIPLEAARIERTRLIIGGSASK
jgi:radical SAM-linked protein